MVGPLWTAEDISYFTPQANYDCDTRARINCNDFALIVQSPDSDFLWSIINTCIVLILMNDVRCIYMHAYIYIFMYIYTRTHVYVIKTFKHVKG